MSEFVIPELLFAEAGVEAAGGGFGASLFGGEAAFAGAEGLAGFGAGEAAGAFGAAEGAGAAGAAAGEFGLGEAGLGAIGTSGLEAGSSAFEALGGYGFEAPALTDAAGAAGGEGTFAAGGATDIAGQGGFVPASSAGEIDSAAINALNDTSLASPEISNAAETTELGSVADQSVASASPTNSQDTGWSGDEWGQQTNEPPSANTTSSLGPTETNTGVPPEQAPPGQTNQALTPDRTGAGPRGAGANNPATSALGKFASNPLSLLQLANAFGNKPETPYLPKGAGYASSLGDFGNQQLAQYNSGALRPEDMSSIMVQQKAALNKMRQFYAQSGNSNSTAAKQAEGQILQQSVALQVQFMNQYLTSGMQALGQASSGLLNAANIDLQSQRSYSEAQSRALSAASRAFSFTGATGGNSSSNQNASGGSAYGDLEAA